MHITVLSSSSSDTHVISFGPLTDQYGFESSSSLTSDFIMGVTGITPRIPSIQEVPIAYHVLLCHIIYIHSRFSTVSGGYGVP